MKNQWLAMAIIAALAIIIIALCVVVAPVKALQMPTNTKAVAAFPNGLPSTQVEYLQPAAPITPIQGSSPYLQ